MKTLGVCWPLLATCLAILGCSSVDDGSQASGRASSNSDGSKDGAGTAATPAAGTPDSSAEPGGDGDPSSGTRAGPSSGTGMGTGTGTGGGTSTAPPSSGASAPLPQSGQLTAGAWDDNRNFQRFTAYRASMDAAQVPGLPPITSAQYGTANALLLGLPGSHQELDIAFVLDTTGSMTDELVYLQSEFSSIANVVNTTYPNATPRWSLIVYRDHSDTYLTRRFDFTSDATAFEKELAAQSADGGGDIPEAPDVALAEAATLDFRADASVARLLFWVADAPHHDADAPAMANALFGLQAQDIHVYPIAASGVDELTELTMRSAAELTGGRYLFLTNDSGIGNDHKEPSIPCYFVTRLDRAMLRMVDIEMTGVYKEPDSLDVIRTGGNPQDGACQLDSGETVLVF